MRHLAAALASLVLSMGAGPGGAVAQPAGRLAELGTTLGLDAETIHAIEQIVQQTRPRADALFARSDEAERTLRDLLDAEEPDEAAVLRQTEELGRLETELRKLRYTSLIRIRKLLTPEQRRRFVELRRKRQRGRQVCRGDIERLCADADVVRKGPRCLVGREDEVSSACREELMKHPKRRGRKP